MNTATCDQRMPREAMIVLSFHRIKNRMVTSKAVLPNRAIVRSATVPHKFANGIMIHQIRVDANDMLVPGYGIPGVCFSDAFGENGQRMGTTGQTLAMTIRRHRPTMTPQLHIVRSRRSAWRRYTAMVWKGDHSVSRRSQITVLFSVAVYQ